MLSLIISFGLALLTLAATTILIFALFKLPIRDNSRQILIFSFVVGFVNFYFKYILVSPLQFVYQIFAFVVLLIILRRYPAIYAIIVSITGFIGSALVDSIASLTFTSLHIFTVDQMVNELGPYITMHIVVISLYMLISALLIKLNIGFSFVKRRFSGNFGISNINYMWASLLIVAMLIIALVTQPEIINTLNLYVILLIGLLFCCSILYAFKQNKVSLNDRYNRVVKEEGK